MTALKKSVAEDPSISVGADSNFLKRIPFPGFKDAATARKHKESLDIDVNIDKNGGLTSTMHQLKPKPEPVVPAGPVEREISLAEILQAITTSRDDICNVLSRDGISQDVRKVLSSVLDRFEHVEKNAQSFVDGNAVVASVERTLSALPKYADEEIAEKRRLRAEVEAMVAEFVAVEKSSASIEFKKQRKIELLESFGLPKWRGKRVDGDPITFLNTHYRKWLPAQVIFNAEVRIMDRELVDGIHQELYKSNPPRKNPLLKKVDLTNLKAAGILGTAQSQAIAKGYVESRPIFRRAASLRERAKRAT